MAKRVGERSDAMLETVEQCKDRIAELTELLGGGAEEVTQLRRLLKTKPAVCEIISFMLKRQVASRTAIYTFLYGARPECDQPEIKIVDVQMVGVRRALARVKILVRSGWGDGSWSISNADKAKLRALMRADEPASDPGTDVAARRRAFWEAW